MARFLLVALAPLAFMFVGTAVRPRPLVVNLSDALAFVGLSMMGLQFGLVARFRSIAAPFGIDILQRFHRAHDERSAVKSVLGISLEGSKVEYATQMTSAPEHAALEMDPEAALAFDVQR